MHDALQHPDARTLVVAYQQGFFPMVYEPGGAIEWIRPLSRALLPLDGLRVGRSLRRRLRSSIFEIRSDTQFEEVMRCCAVRHDGAQTWIDERLIAAFCELHAIGGAHSVEAWRGGRLVAGLYGVHLGGAFFGESMFVRPGLGGTDGSKVCVVHLVAHLRERGFTLLDTQIGNDHMASLGMIEVDDAQFMPMLESAIERGAGWHPFAPDWRKACGARAKGP